MPIVIKLQDIDEAIENLRYKSQTTQKARLLQAIRSCYGGEADVETLEAIDTEELIKTIWETGDDPAQLKAKRKNFSSLKSSVNADLKKLYAEGENPQGLIIGPANIFTISDEAKDKALSGIMEVFREKGIDTQSKLGDILTALSDILTNAVSGSDTVNTQEEIERIKSTLGEITGRLGIPLEDIIRGAQGAAGEGGSLSGTEVDGFGHQDEGQTRPGGIYDELSLIDKGLTGLAHELESTQQKELSISLQRAFAEIKQALADTQTDEHEKIAKIMNAFEQMLAEESQTANVFEGLRRNVITKMGLRDQPILDKYQDEIFRLPLDKRLLILGPPGTGKTTTLIELIAKRVSNPGFSIDDIVVIAATRKSAATLRDQIAVRIVAFGVRVVE